MSLLNLKSSWKYFGASLVVWMCTSASYAELRGFRDREDFAPKTEMQVQSEGSISRRRVRISQKVTEQSAPSIKQLADIDFERVRRFKINEKTDELIKQLESLAARPGQRARAGELKMRLAELDYEKGQSIAASESEDWESRIKNWESLSEEERSKKARPTLLTPKADKYRKKTLGLYNELERMSRGGDRGQSQMIRREEVLYFLASTLMDLGSRKQSLPYYEELVSKYSNGERIFSARMNLADLDFEMGRYEKAVPLYLEVAAGKGAPRGQDTEHLKAYALYKLGWCYMNLNQPSKAVLAFKKTRELSQAAGNDRRIILEKEALGDLARAFALASQYEDGEKYFSSLGEEGEEAFTRFRQEAATMARDNGRLDIADRYYGQLIDADPKADQAREYALELLQISLKRGNVKNYQKALRTFAKEYAAESSWLSSRDEVTQKAFVEELVGLLRREAKNTHRTAQQKDKDELYQAARGYYELYFDLVPSPNVDSVANLHEMRFYQAELLFKLEMYADAAEAYRQVGDGKYASQASYAEILALKEGSKKDKGLSEKLVEASEKFVEANPRDERAGDLLYSSAQEAFKSGDNKQSIAALEKVIERFGDKEVGAEAAERILFILEKEGDVDSAIARSEQFLQNKNLVAAGGPDFSKRLKEISERAEFKKAENIQGNDQVKADSFLVIAKKAKGELREKALNNAIVFAKKVNAVETLNEAQKMLLAEFPNSPFAKDIYFELGESSAKTGKWSESLKAYSLYLKSFGNKKSAETEAAEWNKLFISGSLENIWTVELNLDHSISKELLASSWAFLEKYPKSKNRPKLVEFLAFHKGATETDLTKLKRLAVLSADEKATLKDAEIVLSVRENKNLEQLLRKNPPSSGHSPVVKEALALAAFRGIESDYKKYLQQKVEYTPQKFAKTLGAKTTALEKLEKRYLAVVAYGNGEWALKSLDRMSALNRALAGDIDKAPTNKEELAQFSKPIFEKGLGFLKTCLEKAVELKIGGEGLQTCRSTASKLGATFVTMTDDQVPAPKWLPVVEGVEVHPLLKSSLDALKRSRFGEAALAIELVTKEESKLSPDELSILELLKGLSNYHDKSNDQAVKNFRKATESELPSVKKAAYKNLTALYLEVSDFAQAADAAETLGDNDAEAALLTGLAARGKGQNDVAEKSFAEGLSLQPNNQTLLFNSALVYAALGNMEKASVLMGRYVEMASPAQNDISRELLKRYKQKGNSGVNQ